MSGPSGPSVDEPAAQPKALVREETDVSVEDGDAEEQPHHSCDEQRHNEDLGHQAMLRSERGCNRGHASDDVGERHVERFQDGARQHPSNGFYLRWMPHPELESGHGDHDEPDAAECTRVEERPDGGHEFELPAAVDGGSLGTHQSYGPEEHQKAIEHGGFTEGEVVDGAARDAGNGN